MELLARKWRTLRHDPRGVLSEKLVHLLNELLQAPAKVVLSRSGDLAFLTKRPAHAIPPNFADLAYLYRTVRTRKPVCILEFGSGCSTVVLAQALWDNVHDAPATPGRLYSLDADPFWAAVTAKSLPSHLSAVCQIEHSPVVEVDYNGTRAWRHTAIPRVHPDMVYLDGPVLTPGVQVAVDVLDIESRLSARCLVVVDGRQRNTQFLKQHLRRPFRFTHRPLLINSSFEFTG